MKYCNLKIISISLLFFCYANESSSQMRFGRINYNYNSYRGSSVIWENNSEGAPLRFRNGGGDDDLSEERANKQQFGNVNQGDIKRSLCRGVEGDLDKYRYDATNRKCSLLGVRSHCGVNMIFYGVTHNEVYGECDCLYNSARPLVYHPQTRKCHFVYDQAYCRKGEWLTFRKDGKPECSFNKCQTPIFGKPRPNRDTYVPLNGDGSCVLLNKKSNACPNPNHIVTFTPDELTPRCAKEIPDMRALAVARKLKCRPGTYLNIVGKCQPAFVW